MTPELRAAAGTRTAPQPGPAVSATREITSVAQARERIVSRCFGLRPPGLVGAELEWITRMADGTRPSAQRLAAALGDHAPATVAPGSPHAPLPCGSAVTIEPGGQVEISSLPLPGPAGLLEALEADARVLRALLGAQGIVMVPGPVDTSRPPRRILRVARYAAMQRRFDRHGPLGAAMMCNTAAIHVSVDCGADADALGRRWRMLNAVGPALTAAFAGGEGGLGGPVRAWDADGWASPRMRTWLTLDPARTGLGEGDPSSADDPVGAYTQWALAAPLLCARGEGDDWSVPGDVPFSRWIEGGAGAPPRAPTEADLDYHLTTLFPPVRPCGHLEVRYLDAQAGPGAGWGAPIAAIDALARTPEATDRALALAQPTAGAWRSAARDGLADAALRATAAGLLELAAEAVSGAGDGAGGAVAQALAGAARRCR